MNPLKKKLCGGVWVRGWNDIREQLGLKAQQQFWEQEETPFRHRTFDNILKIRQNIRRQTLIEIKCRVIG